MRLVIIESPYAGDIEANVDFARACVRDSLQRGEAPIASHLLYTQPGILRDEVPAEREWGINAGLAWRVVADATVVYTDRGHHTRHAVWHRCCRRSGHFGRVSDAQQRRQIMTNVTTMQGLIDDYGFTRDEARKYVDMPKRLLLREIRDLIAAVANLDEGDAAELAKVRGEISFLAERHKQDEARIARIVEGNDAYKDALETARAKNAELWRDKSELQAELETTRAKNVELSSQHEWDRNGINRETVWNVLKVYAALEGKDAAIKILTDHGTDSIRELDEDQFEAVIKITHKKARLRPLMHWSRVLERALSMSDDKLDVVRALSKSMSIEERENANDF